MKRKILPYDPALKTLASKLRDNMTFSEVRLWNNLKMRQMMEYDFDRQRPLLSYIVDFYCKDLFLAIEVDGISHHEDGTVAYDSMRQKQLENAGVFFLRFSSIQVVHDMPNVIRAIEHWILDYEDEFGVPEVVRKRRGCK